MYARKEKNAMLPYIQIVLKELQAKYLKFWRQERKLATNWGRTKEMHLEQFLCPRLQTLVTRTVYRA